MAEGQQATSELVGREREILPLEQALAVSTGSRWKVEVVGEPGVGKSRLQQELCRLPETRAFSYSKVAPRSSSRIFPSAS